MTYPQELWLRSSLNDHNVITSLCRFVILCFKWLHLCHKVLGVGRVYFLLLHAALFHIRKTDDLHDF